MYESTLYKISLRTLHEIFEADKADMIEAVSFNGWVNAINKAV
jgi:restriction system protein